MDKNNNMISKERVEELHHYFWQESNDQDTQLWREGLNEKEKGLVFKWDKKVNRGMLTLCEEILKNK